MGLDFLDASRQWYYGNFNSGDILEKVNNAISRNIVVCRPELICILADMVSKDALCILEP